MRSPRPSQSHVERIVKSLRNFSSKFDCLGGRRMALWLEGASSRNPTFTPCGGVAVESMSAAEAQRIRWQAAQQRGGRISRALPSKCSAKVDVRTVGGVG